jgi:hypothetical protein
LNLPNLSDKSVALIPGKTDIARYQTLEGVDFPVRNIVFADLFRHLGTDVPVHDDGALGRDEDISDKSESILVLDESHILTVIFTQVLEELVIYKVRENHLGRFLVILGIDRESILGDDVGHTNFVALVRDGLIEFQEGMKDVMVSSPDVGVDSEFDSQFFAKPINLRKSLIGDEVFIMKGQVQTIQSIIYHILQELVSKGNTIGGKSYNLNTCILQTMNDITNIRM